MHNSYLARNACFNHADPINAEETNPGAERKRALNHEHVFCFDSNWVWVVDLLCELLNNYLKNKNILIDISIFFTFPNFCYFNFPNF